MNLLKETVEKMDLSNLRHEDIVFIGSDKTGHSCTWEEYVALADFEYDEGYGLQKVATDLIIVFNCGTILNREEYNGYEYWTVRKPFTIPTTRKAITSLFSEEGWDRLEDINPTI